MSKHPEKLNEMNRTLVSTHNKNIVYQYLDKLMNSVQYFHPGIEHIVIDTAETNRINEKYPWMRPIWMTRTNFLARAKITDAMTADRTGQRIQVDRILNNDERSV